MEFHVVRGELLAELQLMMGVIEKKNTMPILANVFIAAENNQLVLKATDLEVGIITQCPAQILEPGEFTVNAKQLQDMLNTLGEDQISFSMSDGSMLDMTCGTAKFSIETMATIDFPSIPECSFDDALRFPIGFFDRCINRVLFSISNDPHKYALNGALLTLNEGNMSFVSTDGHRMSIVQKDLGTGSENIELIVPRKTLIELKKSLQAENPEDEFQMVSKDNRVFFQVGVRVLFSRLVDGKFPDFNRAVPSETKHSFTFERAALLNIVKRKIVLRSDKSKLVRLSFQSGELTVVLRNAERGESVDKLAIDYTGEALDVGFNVDYLHDFLRNMNVEKVEMNLQDEASQGLFKVIEEEPEVDYRHIIMPMRLTG